MKFSLAVVAALLLVAVVYAAEDDKKLTAGDRPKTFRRLIPADVLRGKNFEPLFLEPPRGFIIREGVDFFELLFLLKIEKKTKKKLFSAC